MLVGPTGSGKSTIANAIMNGVVFDEDACTYRTLKPIVHGGVEMFKIGDKVVSCTQSPGFCPIVDDRDTYLVDCPGFGDSNKFLELPN